MQWEMEMNRSKTGSKVASLVQSHFEDLLDEGLEETFPASDSVAVDRVDEKLKPAPDNEVSAKRRRKAPRRAK
jgi:hypothetical protein